MPLEAIVRAGNSKLGASIGKVALPAVQTCPGRGECEKVCYAVRLMRIYPSYDAMVQTHLQILENNPEGYFAQVQEDIRINGYGTVRIHESGDFFSREQIEGWHALAVRMPNVRFFAYTRSWNQPNLLASLEAFKSLPNVQVLASVEAGEIAPPSWRTASIVPKGTPNAPGAIVCPEQTGKRSSCADCRYCIEPNASKTQNVLFLKH